MDDHAHPCYPGSPARRILGLYEMEGVGVWRVVIEPRGLFGWMAKPGWYIVRFCPWCGDALPRPQQIVLPDDQQKGLDHGA